MSKASEVTLRSADSDIIDDIILTILAPTISSVSEFIPHRQHTGASVKCVPVFQDLGLLTKYVNIAVTSDIVITDLKI